MRRSAEPPRINLPEFFDSRLRLLNAAGKPDLNLKFYIVNRAGEHAGVSMWFDERQRYAVCTEAGAEIVPCDSLHGERPAAG